MALPEGDSGVGHSFGLEFDGITIKAITEAAGSRWSRTWRSMRKMVRTVGTRSADSRAVRKPPTSP